MTTQDQLDARPLTTDEENAIRDFYARRTTRLAMGPSQSIPRLLATLDRQRNASENIAALGAAAVRERDELREAANAVLPEVIAEELPGVLDGEFADNIDRLKNIGDRWQRLRAALHREDGA